MLTVLGEDMLVEGRRSGLVYGRCDLEAGTTPLVHDPKIMLLLAR